MEQRASSHGDQCPQRGAEPVVEREARQPRAGLAGQRGGKCGETGNELGHHQRRDAPAQDVSLGPADARGRIHRQLAQGRQQSITEEFSRVVPDPVGHDGRQYGGGEHLAQLPRCRRQAAGQEQGGHGRGDQGEGADQVGSRGGDQQTHHSAEGVTEQVHRAPAALLDHPYHDGRLPCRRVVPSRGRVRSAEAGQVHRLAVQPGGQRTGQVGEVGGVAAQTVHVQRGGRTYRTRCAADTQTAAVHHDGAGRPRPAVRVRSGRSAVGPVGQCGHPYRPNRSNLSHRDHHGPESTGQRAQAPSQGGPHTSPGHGITTPQHLSACTQPVDAPPRRNPTTRPQKGTAQALRRAAFFAGFFAALAVFAVFAALAALAVLASAAPAFFVALAGSLAALAALAGFAALAGLVALARLAG